MQINFDLVVFLFLVGITQGLTLIFFFLKKGKSLSYRLLAVMTFLSVFSLLIETLERTGLDDQYPFFKGYSLTTELLIFPLMLLYVQVWTGNRKKAYRSDLVYFIPFVLTTAWWIPFFLSSGQAKTSYFQQGVGGDLYWLVVLKVLIYLGFAILIFKALNKLQFASDRRNTMLKAILIFIFGLSFFALASFFLLYHNVAYIESDLIGGVIHVSIIQTLIWLSLNNFRDLQPKSSLSVNLANRLEKNLYQLETEIAKLMNEGKAYVDQKLTIKKLAEDLSVSSNDLSSYLNGIKGLSFNQWLNRYRIAAFKEKVSSGELRTKTISALAEEVGFGSKASFNRAFKEIEGKTPSGFVNES